MGDPDVDIGDTAVAASLTLQLRTVQADNRSLRDALEEARLAAAQNDRAVYENTKLKAELLHANTQLKNYDDTTAGSQLLRADLEGQVQALHREVPACTQHSGLTAASRSQCCGR